MSLDGQQLPFARDLREALAIYARRTWPVNTSSFAAQAWGISKGTAANVLKLHASDSTITTILRAGGWSLAVAVVGATIGQSLEEFIANEKTRLREERRAHEHRHQRLVEMADHLRPGGSLGLRSPGELRPRERRKRG